jgi:hypothetical protein
MNGRLLFRRVPLLAGVLVFAFAGTSLAQQTTGSIRGSVTASTGEPVAAAEITATNQATGVVLRTTATNEGRYRFPSMPVGIYTVTAQRLGFQTTSLTDIRVNLGATNLANFILEVAVAELEALTVTAETPFIDPDQSGVVDLITAEEVQNIPVAGRNFSDLAALSPRVGVDVGDGTGGGLSIGGGRRGANIIQIDGAGTTGTFFGGEARGSDRIPFAFSIETVQEFQVITNAFDVEFGFFSGGVINTVTKSGTNTIHGSLFGYFRDDKFTKDDFFGRETDFSSRQLGGTLSGPLIRDKLHFFVAVERQDRDEPVIALPNRNDVPDPSSQRAHPDSVGRFLDILENTYGVTDETGVFSQTQDEWSIFARLDWQISPKHRLTGRYNYTDLEQLGDRIGTDETFLNGGIFNNTGRSAVLQLNSIFKPTLWNDFRAQLAFEPRPREANTLLPESEVNVVSDWPDGTSSSLRGMECCNDAVLPNNLEETTLELVDNLNILVQQHQVKLGAHFNLFDYENFFFFNQQGQFDFNSLSDFENGIVDDFGRNLPNPGPDGEFFTDDDVTPIAIYKTYELAMYAQDAWRASDQFTLTGGVRLDLTRIPDAAPLNTELEASLGIRTDEKPEGTYFSPRIGFTYDPSRVGTSVFRGGVGLFYGRFPSVLYSNSLLNTGANQLNLFCQDEEAPVPDYDAYKQDLRNIPTACVGGAEAAAPIPNINAFDADFKYPKTWKFSAGYEQEVFRGFRVGIDALYATTTQNFYVEDRNLLDEQFRSGIENRPVHAPADELSSSSGRPGFGDNRIDTDFGQVLLHTSPAEARTWQATFTIGQRGNGWSWNFGYTWNNSRDNASYSCCISSTAQFETPTAGNPNFLGARGDELVGTWGRADFERTHNFVLSGIWEATSWLSLAGIWRTYSGRPWTPIIDGDANADGGSSNDRAFVGTNLVFENGQEDIDLLNLHIQNFDCLQGEVGQIARRNSCKNDFFSQLDLRFILRGTISGVHRLELLVDVFNVLNMLNSDWSRNVGVPQFGDERQLLEIEGFDEATETYTYSVNPSFGEEIDLVPFRTQQGSLQVGVRWVF